MALESTDGLCAGRWTDGRPCKNRARGGNAYCSLHDGGRVSEPCRHRYEDGRRCRANPGFGSAYCYYHEPVPAQVLVPRSVAQRGVGEHG